VVREVSVELDELTEEKLVAVVNVPTMQLETVGTPFGDFQRISNRDGAFALRGGGMDNLSFPETPMYTLFVALPVDQDAEALAKSISVTPNGAGTTRSGVRLYPIQPPQRDAAGMNPGDPFPVDDESFRFDEARYLQVQADVREVATVFPVGGDEDVNIVEVKIHLVDYDPTQEVLTNYPSLRVEIPFLSATSCFRKVRTAEGLTLDSVDTLLEAQPSVARQSVINPGSLAQFTCPEVFVPVFSGARLVIVTDPSFVSAADDLRTHKIARGISTIVVTTDVTGTTAVEIQQYLTNAYLTWSIRPKWVLLLGDSEFIPTDYGDNNSWDSAKNAGDIYYGQLGGSANGLPVFGIGRLPVDTNAQAQDIVNKIKDYENSPPAALSTYYQSLSFAAQFQDSNLDGQTERAFAQTSENIRDYLVTQSLTVERIYQAPAMSNPTLWADGSAVPSNLQKPTFPWDGSTTDIIDALNDGRSIAYHRNHGWWWGWATPSFSTGNLGSVSVTGHEFPVVYSVNCASGIFDNETVDEPSNFVSAGYGPSTSDVYWGEALVRKTDGAVAVIGDTRSSSTTLNNELAKGLFDATWPKYRSSFGSSSVIRKVGDILNHAKGFVKSLSYDPSSVRQEMKIYNVLGDPTVEVRSRPASFITAGELRFIEPQVVEIPIGCLTCPPFDELEPIFAVLQDSEGTVISRDVVEDGLAILDLGGRQGSLHATISGIDVVTAVVDLSAPAPTP